MAAGLRLELPILPVCRLHRARGATMADLMTSLFGDLGRMQKRQLLLQGINLGQPASGPASKAARVPARSPLGPTPQLTPPQD